jgi:glutathione synthase/RimK-type ligase-like ATP-grasp enzyme
VKPWALIANAENRRAQFFIDACCAAGLPGPRVLSWRDLLVGQVALPAWLEGCGGLRIESPGENFAVERLLISHGAAAAHAEGFWPWTGADEALALAEDHGRIRWQRQWFHGWCRVLTEIDAALIATGLPAMNSPREIAVLFDKAATQARLAAAGVPVAEVLGLPSHFDELRTMMEARGMRRLFLKPCHSSSASGIVALETNGHGRWAATTSARLSRPHGDVEGGNEGDHLHNHLRITRLQDVATIERLVNAVCRERALAERWFPKASLAGRRFDLRVVVIGGVATHVVVRTSYSPLTNLHLGNARGDITAVQTGLGSERWAAAMRVAEQAARAFPGCLYVAVDLMIGLDGNHFCVAEANAFGDLLPNVLWQGRTTYAAELNAAGGVRVR